MFVKFLLKSIAQGSGKISLQAVWVIPFILQIFAAVGLVGYLSYKNGQKAVNTLAIQLQSEVNARIDQYLNTYFVTPQQINQINFEAVELGLLDLEDFERTGEYFWHQMRAFDVSYISFGNTRGEFIGIERLNNGNLLINEVSARVGLGKLHIYASDNQGRRLQLLEVKDWEPRLEAWYTQPLKEGKPLWSDIYQWEDKPEVLSISASYPIYGEDQQEIGVLSIDRVLSQISDTLRDLRTSSSGKIFIVERNGLLVASSTTEKPFQVVEGEATRLNALQSQDSVVRSTTEYLRDRFGSLEEIDRQKMMAFKLEGQRQFLQVMPYRDRLGLDWLVVVVVPESDFTARINANTRTTIALCLAALGLATAMSFLTSRWIARPIYRLGKASRAIADGALDQKVKVEGTRELRVLAGSFNRMSDQLQQSRDRLEEYSRSLQQQVQQQTEELHAEIQERQLLEEKLRTSETKIRAFFEAMSDVVLLVDAQGTDINVAPTNPSRLYNSDFDPIGQTIEQFFGEQSERFLGRIQLALETQQLVNFEYSLPVEDGKDIWFSASISPISDETVIWVARDISDRKRVESALQQAEEKYRSIFENATEGIFQSIPGGGYISANPALARIYGYESPDALLAALDNIGAQVYVDANRRQEFRREIEKSGKVSHFESQVYRADGSTIWISENAHGVRDGQGNLLYYEGIVQDITLRKETEEALRIEQEKSERLLLNILPEPIANQLKHSQSAIAEHFDEVSILFADIVGFTPLSARLKPIELVTLLNQVFSSFDELAERYGLEKIKTIGDAYMVAAGLPIPRVDHADAIANMALAMQHVVSNFDMKLGDNLQIRIGINTGVVIAGVIGTKKFIYDLWGDAVNVASRMESSGKPGCIQITESTYKQLTGKYILEKRGEIEIKGKGAMTTYWLQGKH
ncbi:adenylate/guanylate cyclase domain-containing protein [Lusitaniella coriacea]|uniref:adenylate/guanylate cyclase domain-containing protein n=1 Tax=Lusitaniella coriacea TaxID=1983105 RepID=UPI003CF1C475